MIYFAVKSKEAAGLIRKFARREEAKGRAGDASDLHKLAGLVEAGKNAEAFKFYAEAFKFYKGLDTFVREGVPDEAVVHLSVNRVPGKKSVNVWIRMKGCKKVFKKGFGPGVVWKSYLEFPGDATNDEMARALVLREGEILKKVVVFEFDEPRMI